MKTCEFCNNNHSGVYGSGRFCNKKCACGFSTKEKRQEINLKISKKLEGRIGNNGNGFKSGYDSKRKVLTPEDRNRAKEGVKKYRINYINNTPFENLGKNLRKRILIEERGRKCERCKTVEWLGFPVPLELEHIDGNNKNNVRENSKLLCPNCHALTPTYRGKNIDVTRKINDELFLSALKKETTIRKALIQLKLTPCGGNYVRAKRLLFGV